jgi:hypothetical protein
MRIIPVHIAILLHLVLLRPLAAQPGRGPGPPGPPHDLSQRLKDIAQRLEEGRPSTGEQRELAAFVRQYLSRAAEELAGGRRFQAERMAEAADACRRTIEHLQHAAEGGHPAPPVSPSLDDRLRQVYFRLRLCDFFLQQLPDPKPTRLRDLARLFYERAAAAKERDPNAAEEYALAADDLTHALESLAQAYVAPSPKLL